MSARRDLRVPADSFARGDLVALGLCPKHGRMSTGSEERTFRTALAPGLHLIGFFLPALTLVGLALIRTLTGRLPVCDSCSGTHRARRRDAWVLGLSGFVTFCVGVGTDSTICFLAGFALGVLAVLRGVLTSSQNGVLDRTRRVLTLTHVDPGFADVYEGRSYSPGFTPER